MISSARPNRSKASTACWAAIATKPIPPKAAAGLGKTYETMKIGVKPYPSCRYTHAAIDALLAMRREHNLTPEQIKRAQIGLHRNNITQTNRVVTQMHLT